MKNFGVIQTALIVLSASVVFFVSGQDDAAGTVPGDSVLINIDAVNELASDTALTLGGGAGLGGYTRQPESYALVIMRIIGYLVVVTVFIFALAWGVRKFGAAGVSRVGGGNNMDIIESIYLGQNRGATLVRVGDAVYLLGHTPENVVLIEKIEGNKAVEMIASAQSGAGIVNFKDAFNNFFGKARK